MSYLMARFYDSFMTQAEEACLREWRAALLADLSGDVLELGAGTGANLGAYADAGVRLTLCEPDPHMRRHLEDRLARVRRADVSVAPWTAEHLRAADASQDVVVSSLVCCSVTDLDATLAEVRRVLRPGGRFVFMEHVAAPAGTSRRRWQQALNPAWKRLAGNCHLTRDTEAAIVRAGFTLADIRRESMRKALPMIRPTIRGVALRAPA